MPPPAPRLLGGIHAVTLDEVDPDNIRLENIKFRDPTLEGVVTEEDKERDWERMLLSQSFLSMFPSMTWNS